MAFLCLNIVLCLIAIFNGSIDEIIQPEKESFDIDSLSKNEKTKPDGFIIFDNAKNIMNNSENYLDIFCEKANHCIDIYMESTKNINIDSYGIIEVKKW